MKKIKAICFILISFLLLAGCKKDEVTKQEKGREFIPRIFGETLLFPAGVQVLDEGQSIDFTGLQYSPAGKVNVSWKVNDKEVSTAETYKFTAATAGDYRIKIDVSYEGTTVSRYTDVFVVPQASTYTPKSYTNVVMSYIGEEGVVANLDFGNVTHLTFKAAGITATGTLDVSKGEAGRRMDEIVTRAHLAGVPVLLGVSGALSADGWNVYGSNIFGSAITDPAKRAALVLAIKNYVTTKKIDGVDVLMTDIGNDTESITVSNVAAIGPFLNELRTALGTGKLITASVTTNYVHSYYPNLSAANWINVHAYQDRAKIGPGKPLAQPSGYDYMVAGANLWKAKYPASKLVIGIPAMGIRFTALDANGNNLNNTSFNYLAYKDILAANPANFDKEFAAIDKGVYFNGVPLVTQKSNFVKQNGFLGIYLWLGDYDVKGTNSLTATAYNSLK